MTIEMQKTFGLAFGLGRWELVMPHEDDLVDCEDCTEKQRRGDCTKTDDGLYYKDIENAYNCIECGDSISESQAEDKNDLCDSCHCDKYVTCESCNEDIERDDILYTESCDSLCRDCYDETYTYCEGCSCELANDDAVTRDCMTYCEGCVPDDDCMEINIPSNWSGSNECGEMGSLRKFGVELETTTRTGYSDWLDESAFGAVTDGSTSGMEFVSAPLSGDDGLKAIRKFCASANAANVKLDYRCGFHLHCDLTGSSPGERKSIALAYHYTRELWHDFIDADRRDTNYSKMNWGGANNYWGRKEIMNSPGHLGHPDCYERYVWINWRAFDKHSTVEIRSHHATINDREVCNWVKAHIKFIEAVSKMTVGKVTRMFGNEDSSRQFTELSHIWGDDELSDFYGRIHLMARAA